MEEQEIRAQLKQLLDGGQAHATFDHAVQDFPPELRGKKPNALPYSAWQLVEHVRIAQRDILDWATNEDGSYKEQKWPDDYWPHESEPPSEQAWDEAIEAIRGDRAELEKLVADGDLTKPFAWDKRHNLLRQVLLAADHIAYHTGEIVLLRRLLGCWK